MGFMDSIKKATGIGLSHNEHYQRAFEKGVLLGPTRFVEAVQLFENAAKKAAEVGDVETQTRAIANARLYGYITSGNAQYLPDLRTALEVIPQIEAIGSQSEWIPAQILKAEIEGRILEHSIEVLEEGDHARRAAAHQRTADVFRQIFQAPLATYRFQKSDPHFEMAQSRYFFNQARSSYHRALLAVMTEPEAAAEEMGKALAAFKQCQDEQWSGRAQTWLTGCRVKRTCWLCHRECQGAGIHFQSYAAAVTPYVVALVQKLGQDVSSIDLGGAQIVLCRTCSSGVENIAEAHAARHADRVRDEVMGGLNRVISALESINNRVQTLEVRSYVRG